MTDFLDVLEARVPAEVERRARTLSPNDRRRVRGAIDLALAPAPRVKRSRLWIGLAAAACLIAASAAAAGIAHRAPSSSTTHFEPAPPQTIATHADPVMAFEPAVSVDDLPRVAPDPVVVSTSTSASTSTLESSADLFARANRARQSGDAAGAITLYSKLEKRFPASNEASVAHVSVARIQLDRDPQNALAELDLYLASGATDLREEALALRARAFGTLDRGAEEKRAWQALLAEHPDSLYGGRAKERIAALP